MHAVGESGANVPAFLAKLWKLVEDPALDDLISWNPSGLSFTIRDQARFAREILPLYYKHNNMASFVRQLNMYGFHKVVSLDSGGLKLDKDEMEFAHTYFIRGHEYLLEHIKRKIPISKQDDSKVKPEMLTKVLSDVRSMKGKQETLDNRLATMKKENEALWREVASLRQKHLKQQQIVNKLIQFLISVVQPSGRSGIGSKRKVLMLEGEALSSSQSKNARKGQRIVNINFTKAINKGKASPIIANISPGGPTIHDVTDLIDEMGEEGEAEVTLDPEVTVESEPTVDSQASEVTEPANEIEFPTELLDGQPVIEILPDKPADEQKPELESAHPDLSVVAQLEGSEDSAMLPSPLSPDLMVAVNPNEVVCKRSPLEYASGSNSSTDVLAGSFATGKGKEAKKTNGVSSEKKPAAESEMRLALVDNATNMLGSRDELDNHLDNMQADLESLREILSLQSGSVDAATLLGIKTIGSDDSWRDWLISCSSPPELNFPNLLDHQGLSKLFSADEPTAFLNTLSDVQRPMSSTAGNELMSYNPSLFELTTEDGQFLPDDSSLFVSDLTEDDTCTRDEKADELFLDLLGVTEGPSPVKKTKSN